MTDFIIGLIPDYGLIVLFAVVSLACLAVPLPSSMLVLTSGAFAATGDLNLVQVLITAFAAFVIGDQIAYGLATRAGPRLLGWMRGKERLAPALGKSEAMLAEKGQMAVFLSHTILSPTCPYISYLCGAGGMGWRAFSGVAVIGAAIWVAAYVWLGFIFATELTQVAALLSKFFGLALALAVMIFSLLWLRRKWRDHMEDAASLSEDG